MATTEAKARREEILALTADLRAKLATYRDELAAIQQEIDAGCSHFRLVRLSDRSWDVRAIMDMVNRQIEARVDDFIAA